MTFDERKARRVTAFIEQLKHTKGEFHGKPFKLLPWQEKIIRDVFGTVRDEDPTMRQYTSAYIEIPKKQGKSELGAAIALNMLINDDEWKAEVYSCASDRQQAAIVFDVAVDMVKQSPALMKRIKIIPSMKRMVYQPTGSIYQVLSSEVATKHGLNVSACIFDELHTQPTRALYDVMTQGSGDARKQPLWFFLTTAGTDRNSICWEVHQKALDILEGRKVDTRFYPVIFGLPDEADWTNEENWYKANPSLGHTITIDKVRDAFRKALETPADENQFRQLRLNQWVKQSVRWMPMDKWDECGGVVDPYQLEGRVCYAGLDLSSTSDLTALVLVFPPTSEDEPFIALPFFWLPEDTMANAAWEDNTALTNEAGKGSKGTDVKALQEFLMQLGYSLPKYGADGEFGSETETALKKFQAKVGVKQDGVYGSETHAALMDAVADADDGKEQPDADESDTPAAEEPAVKQVRIVCSSGTVNIRKGNGTQYSRITSVKDGASFEWIATAENGWYAVVVNAQIGWVSGKYSEVV